MSCCKRDQVKCCIDTKQTEMDYLICTCMGVMYSEICEAVEQGFDTFEKLSEKLGVGTGCSSCVAQVTEILEKKLQKKCCNS